MKREELIARITAYLAEGGLFNPELAIHDNVRDLLIDCRAVLSALQDREAVVRENIKRIANSYIQARSRDPDDWVEAMEQILKLLEPK